MQKLITIIFLSFFITSLSEAGLFKGKKTSIRGAVVKIHATIQRPNYMMPWLSGQPIDGKGTGFIIGKKKILTNAHVVSDARVIHIQKDGDAKRYSAKVSFAGHDCDLAILEVDDETFFDGTTTLELSESTPRLNDEVTVYGYPMGGTRISVTKGIVSRIDYSVYTHSAVDQHLVIQVDAAINPGNSGGPVLFNGKVAGLAFQGLSWGENIGYGIPASVLTHFLDDIEDGTYNGYPELGAAYLNSQNPALRKSIGLPSTKNGAILCYIDPFGSAASFLKSGDALLSINDYAIASDGTIELDGNNVIFNELLERKQWGESALFNVWRNNSYTNIVVPLRNPYDPFSYRRRYDVRPEYYVNGGLVFSPLTREYLLTARRRNSANIDQLLYYSQYVKQDKLYKDIDEFVVLIKRLPHPVNTYSAGFLNGVVKNINGVKIKKLTDVKRAMSKPKDGFHVIEFFEMEDKMILDAVLSEKANPMILRKYGITVPEHFTKKTVKAK